MDSPGQFPGFMPQQPPSVTRVDQSPLAAHSPMVQPNVALPPSPQQVSMLQHWLVLSTITANWLSYYSYVFGKRTIEYLCNYRVESVCVCPCLCVFLQDNSIAVPPGFCDHRIFCRTAQNLKICTGSCRKRCFLSSPNNIILRSLGVNKTMHIISYLITVNSKPAYSLKLKVCLSTDGM